MAVMVDDQLAKMRAGERYCCRDDALEARRRVAREAVHQHAHMPPAERGAMAPKLHDLMATVGGGVFVEAPFHCAYGFNIHLADGAYFNAGCVILDTAPLWIGPRTMLGPGVHVYCADHHRDRQRRAAGIERAMPVTIGADVWIGGGAILLPGVSVGDGAIVGAGSVDTREVAAEARVAGNPARPIQPRRTT